MNDKDYEYILRVENISKHFPMRGRPPLKAVDQVSFNIKQGEVLGIVGESGCGKTTAGRCIINLYDLTGGDIYYKDHLINTGVALQKEAIRKVRRSGDFTRASQMKAELKRKRKEVKAAKNSSLINDIQMIFQDPVSSLDPRMTVREIISEGLIIQGEKDQKVIEDKVRAALDYVRLVPEHANRYPHEFSGGQRQRIGIARAMVMKPEVLIADEPVSALDVSIQAQIINLFNKMREDMNMTIIFIAHDLAVVKYFSDRIAVMYFGKMVELASSDELFAHPFHPYTQALLSSVPVPDPRTEVKRKRYTYVPELAHDYSKELPTLQEIRPNHWVRCNTVERNRYLAEDEKRKSLATAAK